MKKRASQRDSSVIQAGITWGQGNIHKYSCCGNCADSFSGFSHLALKLRPNIHVIPVEGETTAVQVLLTSGDFDFKGAGCEADLQLKDATGRRAHLFQPISKYGVPCMIANAVRR